MGWVLFFTLLIANLMAFAVWKYRSDLFKKVDQLIDESNNKPDNEERD